MRLEAMTFSNMYKEIIKRTLFCLCAGHHTLSRSARNMIIDLANNDCFAATRSRYLITLKGLFKGHHVYNGSGKAKRV